MEMYILEIATHEQKASLGLMVTGPILGSCIKSSSPNKNAYLNDITCPFPSYCTVETVDQKEIGPAQRKSIRCKSTGIPPETPQPKTIVCEGNKNKCRNEP